jgi:hypothetical protein
MPKGVYKDQYEVICTVCSLKFLTQRKASIFCSNRCRNAKWRDTNRDKYRDKQRHWVEQNPEQHHKNQYEYKKNRLKTDLLYKLKQRVRCRLGRIKFNRSKRTVEWLGCSIADLKSHLESKFQLGMSWSNYGMWHIDHIIPLASAADENDVLRLCHYTNLQPLWAEDNLRKGDN